MPLFHRPFANHSCAALHPNLIANAQLFLSLAIGESTRQSYSSGVKSYFKFIDTMKISPAFPASIETLCLWISCLAAPPRQLKIGTCKVYLSAIINQHVERGFSNPLENAPPMLQRIFTGIKRWAAHHQQDSNSKHKLPITTSMLRRMAPLLDYSKRGDALVLAMMWVATTAMLRISEFTTDDKDDDRLLCINQLSFVKEDNSITDALSICHFTTCKIKHAILHLKQSKTDPFRKGMDIIVAASETIHALRVYLSHSTHQQLNPRSPLFSSASGQPVRRHWFMRQITTLLAATGYETSQYSSHSFRKGGAVSLQRSGVEDSIIRNLGRWRSDAFHVYLRDPVEETIIDAATRI